MSSLLRIKDWLFWQGVRESPDMRRVEVENPIDMISLAEILDRPAHVENLEEVWSDAAARIKSREDLLKLLSLVGAADAAAFAEYEKLALAIRARFEDETNTEEGFSRGLLLGTLIGRLR